MTGRISHPMTLALRAVARGDTLSAAALRYGVDLRALRRACRRAGMPPRSRRGSGHKLRAPPQLAGPNQ